MKHDFGGLADILSKDEDQAPKTIVFCRTKNDCSKVYLFLRKCAYDKHSVSMYHSSLTQTTKAEIQNKFKSGDHLRCLSATIAFGMVNTIYCFYTRAYMWSAL